MKKAIYVCVVMLVLASITGCLSSGGPRVAAQLDTETPWQQQALIMPLPCRDGAIGGVSIMSPIRINYNDVGVLPAGTHTLNVTAHIVRGMLPWEVGTDGTYTLTYDFKAGERYVLFVTDRFQTDGLHIMTLDEYYASPDINDADKNVKTKWTPEYFAEAEAELNGETQE